MPLLFIVMLCGCDNRPCLSGHDEQYQYLAPIFVGMVNNAPQYIYVQQTGTRMVCDKYGKDQS
jgi:hypothetical protein